jgi:pilus assembly protein FimV
VLEPAPSAESPAFGAPREEPGLEAEGLELDLDLDALAPPAEVKTATTPEFEATAESADLDFSLDFPETAPELEIPAATPEPEISASPVLETEGESIEISAAPLAEEEAHLDFNFDLGGELAPVAAEPAKEPSALPELDLSGISLDLEETTAPQMLAAAPSDAGEGSSAEVATKLDLARAYVEMGDKDGAREILDEVLKEGNAQQQSDANELLASL